MLPYENSFFKIPQAEGGGLNISPRPQSEDLADWAQEIALNCITHVVSLISEGEVSAFGLEQEEEILRLHGVTMTRFPIDDYGTPDADKFAELINSILHRLDRVDTVLIHCAGGIGRAGMTASSVLVAQGMEPEAAMVAVSKARGKTVPETPEQAAFVRGFEIK